MTRIPYQSPTVGTSVVADAIRKRRGSRGLSPLDKALLNAPEIANGWNNLLGAVRTKNSLPNDVREIMILRVAARNSAAFEWLHHAHVGVDAGLTNEQLTIIRDLNTPLPLHTTPAPLSAIQAAALRFAEASTFNVIIPRQTVEDLKLYLTDSQQLLEAAAVPATYNMVSRLLVALDVGEMGAEALPLPETNQEVHRVDVGQGVKLHVKTAKRIIDGEEAPWLIFINSLMSSERMWEGCLPRLSKKYNLLTFDQRGHGESTVPPTAATLPQLADDIATILSSLNIPTPIHAIIGVSLGGATALTFAQEHPTLYTHIIACDTQATSPPASEALWNERIAVAQTGGMEALAKITVPRWFPAPSEYRVGGRRESIIPAMIEATPLAGFIACAKSLQSYDTLPGLADKLKGKKVMLLAGGRDGILPAGLRALSAQLEKDGIDSRYVEIEGCGHLPMVDSTGEFLDAIEPFLA